MTDPINSPPPPSSAPPPSLRPPGGEIGGGGGFMRGRTGGVPNWALLAGAVGLGVVVLLWYSHRKSQQQSTSADTAQQMAVVDTDSQYQSILALLRDQQGQSSQPVSAPPAPAPASSPTAPPGSPPDNSLPPVTKPPDTPTPGRVYVVQQGDSLSALVGKLGTNFTQLYYGNQAVIEQAAIAHGLSSSRGGPNNSPGWWIFPGTRLVY